MPRYYFHLTDGDETLDDPEGLELAGEAAALDEASRLARELAQGKLKDERDWSGWMVAITDESGRQLDSVPIEVLGDE